MNNDIRIGNNIKQARWNRGISQRLLGVKLNDVTPQQISKFERGENRVSASQLFQIAKILKTDVINLYYGCK